MPQCCVVPQCSNRTSGHRFPKDAALRKAWLVAIKRDKYVPSEHSRVCKGHFKKEDYVLPKDSVRATPKPILQKQAVPSIFAWTKTSSDASLLRSERVQKRRRKNQEISYDLNEQIPEEIDPCGVVIENSATVDAVEDDYNFQNEICVQSENIICATVLESVVEETSDALVSEDEPDKRSDNMLPVLKTPCHHAMRIVDYKDRDMWEELKFYTGFDSYNHFMFFFNMLGPSVNQLHYYSSYSLDSDYIIKSLLPEDQFFLVMMKLRRFTINTELTYRFRITKNHVSIFVITWINFLYCQLQEIDVWGCPEIVSNLMKLKGQNWDATVIIDCTEIKIVKPKNPIAQQQTWSNYKSSHTIKVLPAMRPTGSICFISEAYGGAISDRDLFERSGLLDKLTCDDVVLADRGFNIQDLLASRNIKIKIPDFVPAGRGQLKPHQMKRSKKLSSKRIHIERIIGLAKTYNIMTGPLPATLVPLASRIVFICFMVANFRSNIVV